MIIGILASLIYRSSPFRVQKRDYQVISYQAGAILKAHPTVSRVISIGSGPFPQYGVGWEAGYQAAYFGGVALVAVTQSLPAPSQRETLLTDVREGSPDAILLWGTPGDDRYTALDAALEVERPDLMNEKIVDPILGEIGRVFFPSQLNARKQP